MSIAQRSVGNLHERRKITQYNAVGIQRYDAESISAPDQEVNLILGKVGDIISSLTNKKRHEKIRFMSNKVFM
jgi:hypothetical protein